jgi:hypothetical protein
MSKLFFAICCLFLTAGCYQIDNAFIGVNSLSPEVTPDDSERKEERQTQKNPKKGKQACYPGENLDSKACLNTTNKNSVSDPRGDYNYLNPYRDGLPKSSRPAYYVGPARLIDLLVADPDFALGPNFSLQEFLSPQKGRYGVYSTRVLAIIQEMRTLTGVSFRINSGYRSPGYNSGISGSARWSRHMYGDALDFASSGVSLSRLRRLCTDFGASYVSVYKTHVHCDWRYSQPDPAFYDTKVSQYDAQDIDVAGLLSEQVHVHVENWNKGVLLTVDHFEQEDAGELVYEWVVTQPNGGTLRSNDQEFYLEPNEQGVYDVNLTIGQSVTTSGQFSWF